MSKTVEELEAQVRKLKFHIRLAQLNNHQRNLELDALHFVWCSGGCEHGVHRWGHGGLTQEIVDLAVKNTNRLVGWHKNSLRKSRKKTVSLSETLDVARGEECYFCREPLEKTGQHYQDVPGISDTNTVNLCLDCHKDHMSGNSGEEEEIMSDKEVGQIIKDNRDKLSGKVT